LQILVKLHNASYHWISFFAAHEGPHPKHEIQQYHQFFLDNISPTDQVLDIGSGTGSVAFDIATKARKVTGIDILEANVRGAKKQYSRSNLEFIYGDATTFTFTETFDAITLSNVLEHIENRERFLKDIKKLAPKLLIRVPLITRDWISVWKKNEGFSYRLDDTHFIEYTEEGFAEEMRSAGLKIESSYVKFGEFYAVVVKETNI
jgi:2-polyprenyl-3-methyl-5-hydroxy-6-metoxy-1,4-benzoquinol methylase